MYGLCLYDIVLEKNEWIHDENCVNRKQLTILNLNLFMSFPKGHVWFRSSAGMSTQGKGHHFIDHVFLQL